MKKILFTILILLISVRAIAYDYTQDASCSAAYLFTEGTGTTVDDASPNTNTGTFLSSGNPAWDAAVPGAFAAGSVLFSTDYISAADHASLEASGDLSLVSWIYPTGAGTYQILTKDDDGGGNRSYGLVQYGTGMAGAVFKSGDTESILYSSTGLYSLNAWNHLAMAYDYVTDGTSVIELFANGVSVGTKTNCVGPIQNGAAELRMGNRQYASFEGYFPGKYTEGGVFIRKITSTEINDIMDNGLKPTVSATVATIYNTTIYNSTIY